MTVQPTTGFDLDSLVRVLNFFHSSVSLSSMVVTITNYQDGSCAYVSPTFREMSGHDPETFRKGGMNWLVNHIHPEDRQHFKINFTEGFLFLINTPPDQKLNCSFNLTARLLHKKGHPIWIYQQCRPVAFDETGKPLYSLNIMTDLTHVMPGDSQPCWSVFEQHINNKPQLLGGSCGADLAWLFGSAASPLTKRELQVLQHFMKGSSGKEVAARLRVSTNTINTHRKSILRKAGAKNMTEAISIALRNDWLHE